MGKYLRIANRGECPREMFEFLGATDKREDMKDQSVGGWYGTDTKYCPIAALNLGILVSISSSDEVGRYFFHYDSVARKIFGKEKKQLRMIFDGGPTVPRDLLLDACLGWDAPIGDDTMKSYRLLRGYLRNAVDADPEGFKIETVEKLSHAPKGMTYVYLGYDPEFDHMRRHSARYFKWLAKEKPHVVIPGVGAIYAKSDPEATRVFSQGGLGFCSVQPYLRALYDYSLDKKELRAEDSSIRDFGDAQMEINKLLCNWNDVDHLTRIIAGIEDGTATFEAKLIGLLGHLQDIKTPIPAAGAWNEAFHRLYGDTASISCNANADSLAKHSFGRMPITVGNSELKRFLLRCDVDATADYLPDISDQPEYRLVEIDEGEKAKLGMVLAALHKEYPEIAVYPISFYEPLSVKMRSWSGFALRGTDGKPPQIFVQRANLLSTTMLMRVLVHECRHGRSGEDDESRKFVAFADRAEAKLLMEKYQIPDKPVIELASLPLAPADPEPDLLLDLDFDFGDEKGP